MSDIKIPLHYRVAVICVCIVALVIIHLNKIESAHSNSILLTPSIQGKSVSNNDDERLSNKEDKKLNEEGKLTEQKLLENFGKIPLSFEANEGQISKEIRFASRGSNYNLLLTPNNAVLNLSPAVKNKDIKSGKSKIKDFSQKDFPQTIKLNFINSNTTPNVIGLEKLLGQTNYLIGNDQRKWRTAISNYGKVKYENLYSGIDLIYYGNQGQLEYDFVVAPRADPSLIKMNFEGAKKLAIDKSGDLIIKTRGGSLKQHKPRVYQEINGKINEIKGEYVKLTRWDIGFKIGEYDRTRPLVIDPVLVFSTYINNGTGPSQGLGIAVDNSGNSYVVGSTASTNFSTINAVQNSYGGSGYSRDIFYGDAFITKINASGTSVVYSTYIGGNGTDGAADVAVDSAGNAFITGMTGSSNFPTYNALYNQYRDGNDSGDVFLLKLSPNGSSFVFSTYLGGTGIDVGYGLALDTFGNPFVTGYTSSQDFPVVNAVQPGIYGGQDAFVTKFNAAGTQLIYSTFLGGTGADFSQDITVGNDGSAYITGYTESLDFPLVNPYQGFHKGGTTGDFRYDAFVSKISPTGTQLAYSTYFGGSGTDRAYAVAVDSAGQAYIGGDTKSSNLPTTASAYDKTYGGGNKLDGFVCKFNTVGNGLIFSTFLGGSETDALYNLAVNASGDVFLTGNTSSTNFPVTSGTFRPAGSGSAYLTKLENSASSLGYSTLLGNATGRAVFIDGSGGIYIAGSTSYTSSNLFTFEATPGAVRTIPQSDYSNVFITKISEEYSYKASGKITDATGNPISQLPLNVSGSLSRTTRTDENGDYWIGGLTQGGNFTITPSSPSYNYSPSDQFYANLSADKILNFTATLKTFVISGRVKDQTGNPLTNVTMTLAGSQSGSVQTAADGSYSFSVPARGNYTVSPSKTGFAFGPDQRDFVNLASDQTADFTTAVTVSGRISDTAGNNLSDVTVTLDGTFNKTATTDAGGNYAFGNLYAGGNYSVTPTKTGYTFSPAVRSYPTLNTDQTADFIGAQPPSYVVGGRVTVEESQAGYANIEVSLTDGTNSSRYAYTDSSGNYSFASVPAGGPYTLAIRMRGISSTPGSQVISNLTSNQTLNFKVYSLTISGSINFPSSLGSYMVQIRLSGDDSQTFVTNQISPNGSSFYSFKVRPGGNYTVTLDDGFSRPSQSFSNVTSSQYYNFNMPEFVIRGRLSTLSGEPIYSHTVKLEGQYNNAPISLIAHIDSNGYYNFPVRAGGPYKVSPTSPSAYLFSPLNYTFDNIASDQYAYFLAEPSNLTSIYGRVVNQNNIGIGNATINVYGGQDSSVQSNSSGAFVTGNLIAGQNYWIAPSKGNYLFNPLYLSYPNLGSGNSPPAALFTAVKTGTVVLLPARDAYASSTFSTSNFGSGNEIRAGSSTASGTSEEIYLTFDLSGILGNLAAVKLRLYGQATGLSSVSGNIHKVSDTSWLETGNGGITWATKPAKNPQPITSFTVNATPGAWYEIDLTGFINAERDAGKSTVSVALATTGEVGFSRFNSKEAGENKPELFVTTTPMISSASPSVGIAGQSVTISGINFGSLQRDSFISFNGIPATLVSWTDTSLVTTVPLGATTGALTVTVGGVTSNSVMFNVTSLGSVSGTVRRASDNATVNGAIVQVLQNGIVKGTTTTSSGTYTVNNLPAGSYDVRASASGYATTISAGNAINAGTQTTVNFSLPSAGLIGGKITKSDGTTAISGATVKIISNSTVLGTTTTNTTGDYSVGGLTAGTYQVEVSAPGYVAKNQIGVTVTNGTTTTLNLSLSSTSTIFHLHGETSTTTGLFQLKISGPDVASIAIQTADLKSQSTGEKLIKAFDTPTGVPNSAGIIPAGSTVSFTLWMKKTASVGTMYPKAKVYLNSPTGAPLCTVAGTSALGTSLTKYTLSCSINTSVSITSSDRFYLWAGIDLTVGSTTTTFKGELDVEGTLNGNYNSSVVIPLGLAGPVITSLTPNFGQVGDIVTLSGTNFRASQGSGIVKFNGVSALTLNWSNTEIRAAVPTGATTGLVTVESEGAVSNGVNFTVNNSGAISGIISKTSDGSAVGGALVEVLQFNQVKASKVAASNGAYQITGLASGTYVLRVSSAGLGTVLRENIIVRSNDSTSVNVALPNKGTLAGRITKTGSASAISGATIKIYQGETLAASTATNATGDYTITDLGSGNYTVEISATNFQTLSFNPVSISSGATTTFNRSLNPLTFTYHLHGEASNTNGAAQLKIADPDSAVGSYLSDELAGQPIGEKFIKGFDTSANDPGINGTIESGKTISFSFWMRKTANTGTVKPRAKVYLNNMSGQLLCAATSSALLTATLTRFDFSCTLANNINLTTTDRFYLWTGADLTATSASALKAEVDIEGTLNGNYDSVVNIPLAIPNPTITMLSPSQGAVGTIVKINGSNFGAAQGTGVVTFNAVPSQILAWNDTVIITSVPEGALSGFVSVKIQNQNSNSSPFTVIRRPVIESVQPASGRTGGNVTLLGNNFGNSQGTSSVRFNGVTAASSSSWSNNRISVTVPTGAVSGPMVISVNGMDSNASNFTIINTNPADDTDGDGMLDAWEIQYFGNLNQTASGDFDGDGVSNLDEYIRGLNPTKGIVSALEGLINLKVFTQLKP